jgi:hypothetical protein
VKKLDIAAEPDPGFLSSKVSDLRGMPLEFVAVAPWFAEVLSRVIDEAGHSLDVASFQSSV